MANNPRIILLFFIILLLPPVGILAVLNIGILLGVIALAAALYTDYHLVKFTIGHFRSWIDTSPSGLKCLTPVRETIEFQWNEISISGRYKNAKLKHSLFVYAEAQDKLLKIPNAYTAFYSLEKEIASKTNFVEYALAPKETLEDRLKQVAGVS